MTVSSPVLLVVEDELHMRGLLRVTLKHDGFRILESATGREALKLLEQSSPDLVLLDLGLPDLGGLELTCIVRKTSDVPILVLSARDAAEQKIAVLDAGADDYLTKPFAPGELLARIRALLRRSTNPRQEVASEVLRLGDFEIDFEARVVRSPTSTARLTPKEHDLLRVLVKHSGRVVRHQQLLREVWGPHAIDQVQYLRLFVKQLRRKLERSPAVPHYLVTEPGIGYRLRLGDAEVERQRTPS